MDKLMQSEVIVLVPPGEDCVFWREPESSQYFDN